MSSKKLMVINLLMVFLSHFTICSATEQANTASASAGTPNDPLIDENDLRIEILHEGDCSTKKSEIGKSLVVHYDGFLEGTKIKFDSSLDSDEPLVFILGNGDVVKGWDQGLVEMCIGERRRLVVPPHLAYGEKGVPPAIPPNAALDFDITLLDVN